MAALADGILAVAAEYAFRDLLLAAAVADPLWIRRAVDGTETNFELVG